MARPAKSNNDVIELSNSPSAFNNAFTQFLSVNGKNDNIILESEDKNVYVPTGIDLLDTILSGGIGRGFNGYGFTTLVGQSGGGKSALCGSVLGACQKKWGDKFIGVYADSEESITQARLKDLGCIYDVNIVASLTVERVFKLIEYIASFKASNPDTIDIPSVLIWDSIANTPSEADLVVEDAMQNTAGARRALVISKLLPIYIPKMKRYNIALIAVNQYRTKLDIGGNKYTQAPKELKFGRADKSIPGGSSLQYNASQMVEIKQGQEFKTATKEDLLGFPAISVHLNCIKNKRFTPNIPIQLVFNFKTGFSNFWTNFNMLKEFKYITAAAWCTLKSHPTIKFRQKEAITLYNSDSEFRTRFDADVQDCLKLNYINREVGDFKEVLDYEFDELESSDSSIKNNIYSENENQVILNESNDTLNELLDQEFDDYSNEDAE